MALSDTLLGAFTALTGVWFGAALYHTIIMGPTLRAAGAAGLGFAKAHASRHGVGWFFAILAVLSTLAGLGAYFANGLYESPWTAGGLLTTAAVAAVVLALILGATVNRAQEQKLIEVVRQIEDVPTKQQGARLSELGANARRMGTVTTATVGFAWLCLVAGRVLA